MPVAESTHFSDTTYILVLVIIYLAKQGIELRLESCRDRESGQSGLLRPLRF
jgi:hypothetical protein